MKRLILIALILCISRPVLARDLYYGFYEATQYAYKISGVGNMKGGGIDGGIPLVMESWAVIKHDNGDYGYVQLMGIPLSVMEVRLGSSQPQAKEVVMKKLYATWEAALIVRDYIIDSEMGGRFDQGDPYAPTLEALYDVYYKSLDENTPEIPMTYAQFIKEDKL